MMSWKWLGFQVWVMGPQQPVGPTGVLQVWADQLVNPHWREMLMIREVSESYLQLVNSRSMTRGQPAETVVRLRMILSSPAGTAWTDPTNIIKKRANRAMDPARLETRPRERPQEISGRVVNRFWRGFMVTMKGLPNP
jgi:hypothetical protein